MNRLASVLLGGIMLVATSGVAAGGGKGNAPCDPASKVAAQSLLIGLVSDNAGLRDCAACRLGEMKCAAAVIPLMDMLHTGNTERSRIVAALALSRIGDARGTYAVKRAARFDPSARVRLLAAWFYEQYVSPGTYTFIPSGPPSPVIAGN